MCPNRLLEFTIWEKKISLGGIDLLTSRMKIVVNLFKTCEGSFNYGDRLQPPLLLINNRNLLLRYTYKIGREMVLS